jgi:hypothetical protein
MKKCKLLKNRASYTTSTESIRVVAQNIDCLKIGLAYDQNGATPPTLATLLTHTGDIKLTVGGEVEDLVKFQDLYVLNVLWHREPMYLITAGDNQHGMLNDVMLPVKLTTDKQVYVELAYSGLATVDTEKLTLAVIYGDKAFGARPISFQYITGNTATSFAEYDMSKAGRRLVGLLIYNTTIPTTSTFDATIGELKILVKRSEVAHIHFENMDCISVQPEDTTQCGIVDNYRYIDLSDEPIPADDLKVAVKDIASATDAFRIVGVYQ